MDLNSTYVFVEVPDDFVFIDKYDDMIRDGDKVYEENSYYDKIIQFDFKSWIENLKNTHLKKETNEYWNQFCLDAVRSNVYINDRYIKDPTILRERYKELSLETKNIMWLLSSQTAYVVPFNFLNKDILNKGYYLTELSNNDSEMYNVDKKMIISISDYKNRNYFILKNSKVLRIFKMINDNDVTIALVYLDIEFNLNKPENSFLKVEFRPIKNLL